MGIIKDRFKAKADADNAEIKDLLKEHGSKKTKASAEWIRALHDLASSTRAEDSVRKRGSDSTYEHPV